MVTRVVKKDRSMIFNMTVTGNKLLLYSSFAIIKLCLICSGKALGCHNIPLTSVGLHMDTGETFAGSEPKALQCLLRKCANKEMIILIAMKMLLELKMHFNVKQKPA